MSFKVAAASLGDVRADQHLGQARRFVVFDIADDGSFSRSGVREISPPHAEAGEGGAVFRHAEADEGCRPALGGCGFSPSGCGSFRAGGCGGDSSDGTTADDLFTLLSDVSYVLAAKAGPKMRKAFGVHGITVLEADLPFDEAIPKLFVYEQRLNASKRLREEKRHADQPEIR